MEAQGNRCPVKDLFRTYTVDEGLKAIQEAINTADDDD